MNTGYSGTPLFKKIGIKPNMTVTLVDAPAHAVELLEPLPDDVTMKTGVRGKPDIALVSVSYTHLTLPTILLV